MDSRPSSSFPQPGARAGLLVLTVLVTAGVVACGGGPPEVPEPRPLVIRSGARLTPDKERLRDIDAWFRPQLENINQDPSFFIQVVDRDTPAYPWESLVMEGDTATIGLETQKSPEAQTAYLIYAHLHLMDRMGRLDEWLPGAEGMEGFELERAMVSRTSDVWLFGRSAFDATPYEPLEEIMYSKENGYLDAFLLTARGEDFPEARQAWLQEDPQALERYRQWFVETFEEEPPGLREEGGS